MNYQLGALGDIQHFGSVVPNFCSKVRPKPGCSPIAGICKPMDVATLDLFKELQRQLNRVAQARGYSKIDVDGRIGAGTVSLYQKAMNQTGLSCDTVALVASSAVQSLKAMADQLGVPGVVGGPVVQISPPSKPNPDGTVSDPPGIVMGLTAITGSIPGGNLFVLLGLGLIGFAVYKNRKGKGARGGKVSGRRSGRRVRKARARVRRARRRIRRRR